MTHISASNQAFFSNAPYHVLLCLAYTVQHVRDCYLTMRRLKIDSRVELSLTKDLFDNIPSYAILSHA